MNSGVWSDLEQFIRGLILKKKYDTVRVVTGPLYEQTKYIGAKGSKIPIPTHLFKVIVAEKGNVRWHRAYLMKNKNIDVSKSISEFIIPLRDLEMKSGLRFFPLLKLK